VIRPVSLSVALFAPGEHYAEFTGCSDSDHPDPTEFNGWLVLVSSGL
jgi:hypothetical protein